MMSSWCTKEDNKILIPITIKIPQTLKSLAENRAEEEDRSLASLFRVAVKEYRNKDEDKKLKDEINAHPVGSVDYLIEERKRKNKNLE